MQTITRAELLGAHPSVQDLNIVSGNSINNPVKAARMQQFRNRNSQFIGDDHRPLRGGNNASCAPTGGQRIVVHRNEDNIKKGRAPPSVIGAAIITSPSGGGRNNQEQQQPPELPPGAPLNMSVPRGNAAATNNSNNNLPPRSPNNNNNTSSMDTRLRALDLPHLLRHAAQRRRPGAPPSDISLVTSVESRDASTNHPCSETVYTCSCCRPRKPRSSVGAGGGSLVAGSSARSAYSDSEVESGLYDNLTSVSQQGSSRNNNNNNNNNNNKKQQLPPMEQQISARQIFELQQARAGGAGSLGHNLIGTSGRGPKAMGFGLCSQELMKTGKMLAAAGNNNQQQQQQGSNVGKKTVITDLTGTSVARASSRASSSAVRKLEEALEQERKDRLATEAQISKIRERQERLLATLSAEEKAKMKALMDA